MCDIYIRLWGPEWRNRYKRLANGWTVRGSDRGEGDISRTLPDRPWGHTAPVQRVLGLFAESKAAGAWR